MLPNRATHHIFPCDIGQTLGTIWTWLHNISESKHAENMIG